MSPNEDYLTQSGNFNGHITQKKGQYAVKCMTRGEEDASIALARYANLKLPSKAKSLRVWHRRLCHLGIRNVFKLARRAEGIIISRDRQDNSPAACEHCANGKGHKQEYATKHLSSRAKEMGDRMHTDLKEVNFGTPERYFMIIVDDHSRYTWAFPLKYKSDAFETYQNFEKWFYTQFRRLIKKLHLRTAKTRYDSVSDDVATTLRGNTIDLSRQAAAYAIQQETEFVGLFDWDSMFLFQFDELDLDEEIIGDSAYGNGLTTEDQNSSERLCLDSYLPLAKRRLGHKQRMLSLANLICFIRTNESSSAVMPLRKAGFWMVGISASDGQDVLSTLHDVSRCQTDQSLDCAAVG